MQNRHDNLEGTLVQLLMFVNRYASSVILYGNRVVFVDGYFNIMTEACHGLVNRVVYRLVDKMVKTLLTDVADVHGRALAHGFKTLQHLYVGG